MSTGSATSDGGQSTVDWRAVAIFAGGVEHLDGALEGAVAPAIRKALEQGALSRWYFSRWVDQRGPHLRLALAGEGVEVIVEQIGRALSPALEGEDIRRPVMPPPTSQRRGGRRVGVEAAEHRPERERFGAVLPNAETLFEASSDVVVDTLPALPRGQERVAYGLALMMALSELGLAREQRPGFWDDIAARWTGTDESGRKVLDRLAGHARRMGPELADVASRLRAEAGPAAGLERYAHACEQMLAAAGDASPSDLVRHHAHLTNNRLGVNPLEEILLASVLAGGLAPRSASTAPAPQADDQAAGEVVHFEEVSKDEGGHTVLASVSLTVAEGEVFGLVGPQGAGKSSLLGVAAGLRVVSAGTVRVLGADPVGDRRQLAGDIGVALPEDELATTRSVRENLELRTRPEGTTADDVLETIGLRERSATAIEDLAPGERRRVALGCALMSRPGVVFLDEPTTDLSAVEREEVWQVLRHLRAGGTTVILATTSLQEMRSVCDRAALMLAGQIVDVAEPDELAEHHFSPRSVHFRTVEEPDVALLQDLPEVTAVDVDQRADHFALAVTTLQPDEFLRVIGNDPDFPEVASVAVEDLEATFLTHAQAADEDPT